ncbi:MAG: HAD family hydrolase [Anaerolineales bacterium]
MQALIFDFDGLILDTEMPDYQSWQRVYQSYGQELPLEKWATIVGGTGESDFDPNDYLEELTGQRVDREQIWIDRRKDYLEHLEQQPVLPGVTAYLEDAVRLGLRLGVASSSPQNWVEGHLTRLGLRDYFEQVVTADDVERTKPDPALFLLTAQRLDVQPAQAIVFEDSHNGVLAGKRAGMFVVAVPNPLTAGMDFSQADLRLDSLADLPLDKLLAKFKAG